MFASQISETKKNRRQYVQILRIILINLIKTISYQQDLLKN